MEVHRLVSACCAHLEFLQLGLPSLLRQDGQALQFPHHDLHLLAQARILLPAGLCQLCALWLGGVIATCQASRCADQQMSIRSSWCGLQRKGSCLCKLVCAIRAYFKELSQQQPECSCASHAGVQQALQPLPGPSEGVRRMRAPRST